MFIIHPRSYSQPQANTTLFYFIFIYFFKHYFFSVSELLLFLYFSYEGNHIIRVLLYVASFTQCCMVFIHVLACISIFIYFPLYYVVIFHCIDIYHVLIIHLPVNGSLDLFSFLAIMNKTTMNIHFQDFVCVF